MPGNLIHRAIWHSPKNVRQAGELFSGGISLLQRQVDWFWGENIDLSSFQMQTRFYFLVGEPREAPKMSENMS